MRISSLTEAQRMPRCCQLLGMTAERYMELRATEKTLIEKLRSYASWTSPAWKLELPHAYSLAKGFSF